MTDPTFDHIKPYSLSAWAMACRPKTWMIALAPVILGLALALHINKTINIPVAIATGLLSVLMQAITNMENDAAYTRRKAEKSNRKGLRSDYFPLQRLKEPSKFWL